jgi:hypothetical protein
MAYCALHDKTFSDVEDCPHCVWEEEYENCTCDIDGEDSCPVHYPIDDGSEEEDDCMDCRKGA